MMLYLIRNSECVCLNYCCRGPFSLPFCFLQVQRNCCLTLCNFSIPEELEFQYHRVNQLLLWILEPARQDESIQRIAVHLCNALVCQVDNDHKEAVGKMGFVTVRRGIWEVRYPVASVGLGAISN